MSNEVLIKEVVMMKNMLKDLSGTLDGVSKKIDEIHKGHLEGEEASQALSREFTDRISGVLGGMMTQGVEEQPLSTPPNTGDLNDLLESLKDFRSKIKDVTGEID